MPKEKACRKCRFIHGKDKCPKCGSNIISESWKGRIEVVNPEKSEIAKDLKLIEKGSYSIKSD
jgi:DNA-directed RNA polymerase subunit E"